MSFEGRFIYLKLIIFSALFFSGSYQIHKAIMNKQAEKKLRFEGGVVKDPNDPEAVKKLTET